MVRKDKNRVNDPNAEKVECCLGMSSDALSYNTTSVLPGDFPRPTQCCGRGEVMGSVVAWTGSFRLISGFGEIESLVEGVLG